MRSAPNAAWIHFTAEMEVDAARSRFRWEAGFGGGRLRLFRVTDAYEDGRGELAVRVGGIVPVKKMAGPEFDKGELQRYLASVALCPPILLNHPSLVWSVAGNAALGLRDAADPNGAAIQIEIGGDGCPVACRAERPRALGNQTVPTPWSAAAFDFYEREGLRVARRLEAAWDLPEGAFTYYRAEVTSFTAVR
jgi:hypothetical protein